MENKINIAELLKDCPKGMDLDCAMYDNVQFGIVQDGNAFPIKINTPEGIISLSKYGSYSLNPQSKCVIFPKGKTTWEGFHRPFVEGDIVAIDSTGGSQVFIFKEYIEGEKDYVHCYMMLDDDGAVDFGCGKYYVERFASREEQERLFEAIKEKGYRWDPVNDTLEKLIEPKFRVGDIVKSKNCPTADSFVIVGVNEDSYSINLKNYCIKFKDQDNYELLNGPKFKVGDNIRLKGTSAIYVVTEIREDRYMLDDKDISLRFKTQDQWELVSDKFDITTLKPFDKVLVRDNDKGRWDITFYELYDNTNMVYPYRTLGGAIYKRCIPYEGNEHLLGKTDDCIDFYKTWE